MFEKLKIENNFHSVTKKSKTPIKVKNCKYVNLIESTPQKYEESPLKKISVTETCQKDCFFNNYNFDSETLSSVASWSSSSNDVLCSNNPQVIKDLTPLCLTVIYCLCFTIIHT